MHVRGEPVTVGQIVQFKEWAEQAKRTLTITSKYLGDRLCAECEVDNTSICLKRDCSMIMTLLKDTYQKCPSLE